MIEPNRSWTCSGSAGDGEGVRPLRAKRPIHSMLLRSMLLRSLLLKSWLLKSSLIMLTWFSIFLQADAQTSRKSGGVASGSWGGEHIVLEVSEKGAEAEFDCAHGQTTQPITIDKNGDFDVEGTFTAEHGGPVRRDENPPIASARYSGHVEGDNMSLTVTVGEEKVGSFRLARGSVPNLTKCR